MRVSNRTSCDTRLPKREHSELPRSRKPREYLDAHTSTTRNPCLYLGAPYRFASFKRSTWSGERSDWMSADTGMSYQSCSTRQNDGSNGRGYGHGAPWKPV